MQQDFEPAWLRRKREEEKEERFFRQAPTHLWVQFIGGPNNGKQEYLEWRKYPEIQPGKLFQTFCQEPISWKPSQTDISGMHLETATYKPTFIPLAETSFSNGAQIVIALFQE